MKVSESEQVINIRSSMNITTLKRLLNIMQPTENSIISSRNSKGIKLLTRLCLGLSHFSEYKIRHIFQKYT